MCRMQRKFASPVRVPFRNSRINSLMIRVCISLLSNYYSSLLTSQIRIRVGEYDFSHVQEQLPYTERAVARKVVHPKYNFFTYEFDLALVKLEQPLVFAPHISPICLPATDDLLIGENATVTGWGRLSEGGTLPSVLQEVSSEENFSNYFSNRVTLNNWSCCANKVTLQLVHSAECGVEEVLIRSNLFSALPLNVCTITRGVNWNFRCSILLTRFAMPLNMQWVLGWRRGGLLRIYWILIVFGGIQFPFMQIYITI